MYNLAGCFIAWRQIKVAQQLILRSRRTPANGPGLLPSVRIYKENMAYKR
jgi:hypothetical protein